MTDLEAQRARRLLCKISRQFDAYFYLAENPDVAKAGINPLAHFLTSGIYEGRSPSSKASSDDIRKLISEELADSSILSTLVESAAKTLRARIEDAVLRTRLRFSSLEDAIKKKQIATDSEQIKNTEALEGRMDLYFFNRTNSASQKFETRKAAAHYLLAEGADRFDAISFQLRPDLRFYSALYPDLDGFNERALYRHWLTAGLGEGRFISERHLLRSFGIFADDVLKTFPYKEYLATATDVPMDWSIERALHHFLYAGIFDPLLTLPFGADTKNLIDERLMALSHQNILSAGDAAFKWRAKGFGGGAVDYLINRWLAESGAIRSDDGIAVALAETAPIYQFWYWHSKYAGYSRIGLIHDACRAAANASDLENDSLWAESLRLDALEREFDVMRRRAQRLAELDSAEAAKQSLEDAIDNASDNLAFYGGRAPSAWRSLRPSTRPLRVGFLADQYLPQCKLYRVEQKIEQFEAAGIEVGLFDFRTDCDRALKEVGLFDAWLFYRTPAFFDVLKLIAAARRLKVPTIFEIDDLLTDPLHFPESIESYGGALDAKEYAGLLLTPSYVGAIARRCDYALASTPTLARELAKLAIKGRSFVHRNALGKAHMHAISAGTPRPHVVRDGRIVLFYGSGTRAHKDFLSEVFFSALAEVMRLRPNVDFHAVGYVGDEALKAEFGERVRIRDPEWDIGAYWRLLAESDVNLAILKKSLLTDCKSEIKWLEAAMLGIPSILSATATHTEVANEGRTAILANDRTEWIGRMLDLIDNPKKRSAIGEAAREKALSEYALEPMATSLAAIFDEIEELSLAG